MVYYNISDEAGARVFGVVHVTKIRKAMNYWRVSISSLSQSWNDL